MIVSFNACEKDSELQLSEVTEECITEDCISSLNPSISINKNFREAGVSHPRRLKSKFKAWFLKNDVGRWRQQYGQPAWRLLQGDADIVNGISQFYLPLIKRNSERVEAVVVITALEEKGVYRFKFIRRDQVLDFPQKIVATSFNDDEIEVQFTLQAIAEIFLDFTIIVFSQNDNQLLELLPDSIAERYRQKDELCVTRYYQVNYIDTRDGSILYSYIEEETTCLYVPPSGGFGGGGQIVTPPSNNNIRINTRDRCEEDGVGCDEEEDTILNPSSSYTPGDRPLAVYDDKCSGLSGLWERSTSDGNREVYGVLTVGGRFLITQVVGASGGQVNGLYRQRDPISGEMITYYYYPSNQDLVNLRGETVTTTPAFHFIPIQATIHSHSPCVADGSNGITNRLVDADQSLATRFSHIKHYILGCNAIGQFSGDSNEPFEINTGESIDDLCVYFN